MAKLRRVNKVAISVFRQKKTETPHCTVHVTRRRKGAEIYFYPDITRVYDVRSPQRLIRAESMLRSFVHKTRWFIKGNKLF